MHGIKNKNLKFPQSFEREHFYWSDVYSSWQEPADKPILSIIKSGGFKIKRKIMNLDFIYMYIKFAKNKNRGKNKTYQVYLHGNSKILWGELDNQDLLHITPL